MSGNAWEAIVRYEKMRAQPGRLAKAWRSIRRRAGRNAHGSTNADPAMDIEVQVRVLKAAVHVIYGVELAGWVVESIQNGEIKLDVRP